jgi:hypothetical protein
MCVLPKSHYEYAYVTLSSVFFFFFLTDLNSDILNNDFLFRDFSLLRPLSNNNTVKFILQKKIRIIKSQILKWANVDRVESLQNLERELQGKRTCETIFITWQLYLNGS